jgi:hypothetical protein
VPAKALDRNLLIDTWNIRAFGDLTEKWEPAEEDSPKRDLLSVLCIAEILSRFDVIVVQEAKDNLKALRHLDPRARTLLGSEPHRRQGGRPRQR